MKSNQPPGLTEDCRQDTAYADIFGEYIKQLQQAGITRRIDDLNASHIHNLALYSS